MAIYKVHQRGKTVQTRIGVKGSHPSQVAEFRGFIQPVTRHMDRMNSTFPRALYKLIKMALVTVI
jgi:hypothetical protein